MKRLFCLICAASLLLVGCEDTAVQSDTSEYSEPPVQTTTTAATTVSSAVQGDDLVEYVGLPVDGGVSLTNEHSVLRDTFGGADEYCDFEELGIKLTVSDDFRDRALEMVKSEDGFDPNYNILESNGTMGMDDGCCYFRAFAYYFTETESAGDGMVGLYGEGAGESIDYYFCYNCDTDELTWMYPLEGYSDICAVSSDVMVLRGDGRYVAYDRANGKTVQLPEDAYNITLVEDKVFFEAMPIEESQNPFYRDVYWIDMSVGAAAIPNQTSLRTEYSYGSMQRGVYNIVYGAGNQWYALNGSEYLRYDPRGRVEDLVTETYYPCSVMREKNALGYRTRYSITDRNDREYVLGYTQTDVSTNVFMNATQDGIIFLRINQEMLVLSAENGDFTNIKAAFLPREVLTETWYDVYCDNERLYLQGTDSLITLCRE